MLFTAPSPIKHGLEVLVILVKPERYSHQLLFARSASEAFPKNVEALQTETRRGMAELEDPLTGVLLARHNYWWLVRAFGPNGPSPFRFRYHSISVSHSINTSNFSGVNGAGFPRTIPDTDFHSSPKTPHFHHTWMPGEMKMHVPNGTKLSGNPLLIHTLWRFQNAIGDCTIQNRGLRFKC